MVIVYYSDGKEVGRNYINTAYFSYNDCKKYIRNAVINFAKVFRFDNHTKHYNCE